ncbi:hypothetical protein [Streptomyces sp. NPDC088246]|uniref:hypothetical protein n=1 Tax=Streptomyces sp. NPDC088246 TaxID=3365842 RepID=UPI003808B81C
MERRVRDELALMFCKRIATKIKKAKEELEEIRLAEREMTEALIGNYRSVLKDIDDGGPAQAALAKAAEMTAGAVAALQGLDGRPRRVHQRDRRGRQAHRHLLGHAELAEGRGRQDAAGAVHPQALRGWAST